MFGAGAEVFAVWTFAIANKNADQEVELNSVYLAAVIGCPEGAVRKAIEYLTGVDQRSRSGDENGRRLVQVDAMRYRLVNGEKYDRIVNREARKEQNRKSQQRFREKSSVSKRKRTVSVGNQKSAPVAVALAVPVSPPGGKTIPPAAPPKRGARVSGPSVVFEEVWKRFWLHGPLRKDKLNKLAAWTQWASWLAGRSIRHMPGRQFATEQEMADGTAAYAALVEQENPEPRYIKSPETFYGEKRHFSAQYQPVAHEPSEEDLLRQASPEQRRRIARIEQIVAEDAAEEARSAR